MFHGVFTLFVPINLGLNAVLVKVLFLLCFHKVFPAKSGVKLKAQNGLGQLFTKYTYAMKASYPHRCPHSNKCMFNFLPVENRHLSTAYWTLPLHVVPADS